MTGGVLVIGSLFWQDHLINFGDNVRKNWRDNNLSFENRIRVKAPIRYGRKSNGNVYTMTLSNDCNNENFGSAFLIPFKNRKIDIDALKIEVKSLSEAEGMKGHLVAGNNNPWAVLGIKFNSERINKHTNADLINFWSKQINNEVHFDPLKFKIGEEEPAILQNGILNIPKLEALNPKDQILIDDLDFVSATVTKPTDYPHISDLLASVNSDLTRKYFLNNVAVGIQTFQDKLVLEKMDKNVLLEMGISSKL